VPYKAGFYSILYVESHGLRARDTGSPRTIHKTYGRWMRNLTDSISTASRGGNAPPPAQAADSDDADDKDDAPPGGK